MRLRDFATLREVSPSLGNLAEIRVVGSGTIG